MTPELADEDVRLTLLHTSDWHLGRSMKLFDADAQRTLSQRRFEMVANVVQLANQRADALLVAGDIFDGPVPGERVWKALAARLQNLSSRCVAFLLPGNHDPLNEASPYFHTHPFRSALPPNVHVIDRSDFSYVFGSDEAVLYAIPLTSNAGGPDSVLELPARDPGDVRIRVAMAHGQAGGYPGSAPHPIAKTGGIQRGFNYVALGDYHDQQCVAEPNHEGVGTMYYSGAPEPMTFGESGAGSVLLVRLGRHGRPPRVESMPIGHFRWRQETCESLQQLRDLLDEDLSRTVLRLRLDFAATLDQEREVTRLLRLFRGDAIEAGRVGILESVQNDVYVSDDAFEQPLPDHLPSSLHSVRARLTELLSDPEKAEEARSALRHLHELIAGEAR